MIRLHLRFYEELNDFLPQEKRKVSFDHTLVTKSSVKDVIESLGVPHTEVDLILVNGNSVSFAYQVQDEDQISAYPQFESFDISEVTRLRPEPLRDPRFILDVHLGKLARYLRLLGFDVAYENHFADETIAKRSHQEQRIALTRDVGLLKNNIITRGYWVRNTDPEKQITEILQRFDLLKKCRPFTRCLECNGILEDVDKNKISDNLPPLTQQYYENFTQCYSCKRVYWEGTHYHKLKKWVNAILRSTLR